MSGATLTFSEASESFSAQLSLTFLVTNGPPRPTRVCHPGRASFWVQVYNSSPLYSQCCFPGFQLWGVNCSQKILNGKIQKLTMQEVLEREREPTVSQLSHYTEPTFSQLSHYTVTIFLFHY